ncbi:hypothetical protein AOLI_G00066410 [Acnodon oligacanthus]
MSKLQGKGDVRYVAAHTAFSQQQQTTDHSELMYLIPQDTFLRRYSDPIWTKRLMTMMMMMMMMMMIFEEIRF